MQVSTLRLNNSTFLQIKTASADMSVMLATATREAAIAHASQIRARAARLIAQADLIETASLELPCADEGTQDKTPTSNARFCWTA